MFRACLAVMAVSLSVSVSRAQSSTVTAELERLERASWVAWQNHDGKFFSEFLSDDHSEVAGSGIANKQSVVSFVASGACTVSNYSLDEMNVRQLADNVAVVTYRATQNTMCGKTKVPSPAWVSSTFVKRDGRWRNAIYQQTPAPSQRDLTSATDSLRKLVQSGFVPSVAYSVSDRAGIVEEGAFGFADVEHRRTASAFTAYPVASVAKSLTAIAALRAVDAGRLDLDRPANSYLGRDSIMVPVGDARRLTTRALLHMTAGIPHVVRFYWPDEPRDAGLDRPLGHFAAFAPGTQFHYSNQSLGIVGEILSRISGESFPRYMTESVFEPLGMANTAVRAADFPSATRALAYRDHPMRESGFTRLDPEPGAGMYTSAHDLGILARRVLLDPGSRFLSAASKSALTDFSEYPFYSSGWWKDPFRPTGLTLLADGAALGHAASMKVLPREGVAVAVLVNGSAPDGFTLGLCDLLLRAAGYAVFFSNPRGSKGYGRDHCAAIRGDWGNKDWMDIQACEKRLCISWTSRDAE